MLKFTYVDNDPDNFTKVYIYWQMETALKVALSPS